MIVRCKTIANGELLTPGKSYRLIDAGDLGFMIFNDFGACRWYPKSNFYTFDEERDRKIGEIIKDDNSL